MKKLLAIILSFVLITCLLSACSEKDNNSSTDMNDYDGQYQGFETDASTDETDDEANEDENSTENESTDESDSVTSDDADDEVDDKDNSSKNNSSKNNSSKKNNSKKNNSKNNSSKNNNSKNNNSKNNADKDEDGKDNKEPSKNNSSKNNSSKNTNKNDGSSSKKPSGGSSSMQDFIEDIPSKNQNNDNYWGEVIPDDPDSDSTEEPEEIVLEKNQLPNYNINIDNLYEYEQDGRYVKMVEEATLQDYNTYVSKLIKDGYSKYDENSANGNKFVTLVNKNTFVSVSYTVGNSKLKVVSEPIGALYPRKQDNKYTEKNMKSLFTGLKNQNRPIYSGMGFIIRLSDGRFIVIDGGGGDYNSIDSNNMMNVLLEQSPQGTEKPVIAAWIFTHAHDDHIGAFNAFTADFANKVTIESFYYNFPPVKVIKDKTAGLDHEEYYSYSNFLKCVKKYPGAKIIRPHSGEKYYISNAVIDMLFSYEDLFPLSLEDGSLGDFNCTSLIFKINIGGQAMLITGDATTDAMYFVQDNFGSFAQSDILQMAHHGQFGTRSFYSLVNPTYVLLPLSHVDTNRVNSIDANRWLVNSSKVRHIITFWSGNVTIPLPYNPTDAQIYERIPSRYNYYYRFPIN